MSGSKRTVLQRGRRATIFSREALALFATLERRSDRRSEAYKAKERELARLLGLVDEWWSGNSVCDRIDGPCHPPQYVAHRD
jgi:hypothetical protein